MAIVSSLPEREDSFVGRQAELSALATALAEGARLVAIVGTAGVGKTRVALELARGDARADVAVACDLVEARSTLDMCALLARLLGVPLTSSREAEVVEAVGRALASRGHFILVLDNFEQLPTSASSVVRRWVEQAPRARVVVTSREPLGLSEETVFRLDPLPVTGDRSDAARLFVERARGARAKLTEDRELWSAAQIIGERLEGIPLAIELAAARVGLFGPRQILERLDQGLSLLGSPPGARPPRHATMRATIAWSWELLEDPARETLARCSVFRGGFSLEAVEAVVRPPAGGSVLDLLEELTRGSLVRAHEVSDLHAEPRFSLYTVIREFAEGELDARGLRAATTEARDRYYLAAASAWARQVNGHGGRESARRLVLEQENLVAVVDDALAAPPSKEVARRAITALTCLSPVMLRRSCALLRALLERSIDLAMRAGLPEDDDALLRARLSFAKTLRITGESRRAVAEGEVVLGAAAAKLDPALEVEALLHLGECQRHQIEWLAAADTLRRGIERCMECGLRPLEAQLRACRGAVLLNDARFDEALGELTRALDLATRLGDEMTTAAAIHSIGHAHCERGDLPAARAFLERALAAARDAGDRLAESGVTSDLGFVRAQEGELEAAADHCERARQLHVEVGNLRGEGAMLAYRGLILQWLGRLEEARVLMEQALEIFEATRDDVFRRHVLGRLGALMADAGDLERARESFGQARALHAKLDDPLGLVLLELDEAHLSVVLGRAAMARGDLASARAHRSEVERRIQAARTRDGDRAPAVERSDDARLAVRWLQRAVDAMVVPGQALLVGDDFTVFRGATGTVGDLRRRPLLRRLLAELVRLREERPGEEASWRALAAVGWPGQQAARQVAKNRLYVALATLRRSGLREVLEGHGEGWRLAPEVALLIVPSGELTRQGRE